MSKENPTTAWRRRRYGELQRKAESWSIDYEINGLNAAFSSLTVHAGHSHNLIAQCPPDPMPSCPAASAGQFLPSGASCTTDTVNPPTPRDLVSDMEDLAHIQLGLARNMMIFTLSGTSLRFVRHPLESKPDGAQPGETDGVGGVPALDGEDPSNTIFLEYSDWLSSSLTTLESMGSVEEKETDAARKRLIDQIMEELQRLTDLREMEWERQQIAAARGSKGTLPADHVDTSA